VPLADVGTAAGVVQTGMTAKDLLNAMPTALDRDAAGSTSAVIQYQLSEPLHHVLDNGRLETHDGHAEAPDVTVTMSDDDLVALFRGELNPMVAYMTGRIKVSGDVNLAQRLVSLFDQEALRSLG
jgi:putative sterol carrier protein